MSRTYKDKPWKHWTEAEQRVQNDYSKWYDISEGRHVYWRYSRLNSECCCENENRTRFPRCRCAEPCECPATIPARMDYDCRHRAWPKYRYVRWAPCGN